MLCDDQSDAQGRMHRDGCTGTTGTTGTKGNRPTALPLREHARRAIEDDARVVAARDVDDLEVFDFESAHHGVIDPQESGAVGGRTPGPRDGTPVPLRALDRAIGEEESHASIDRPDRVAL